MKKITVDPLTRIEGHMKVEVMVDNGEIKEASSTGTLFRGFEIILKGRHPLDANRLTQRICGVCPASHSTASALCLDDAFGIGGKITDNGRIIRNLILGSNFLQSHILHFYHLAALDYVDVTSVAKYKGDDPSLKSINDFIARGQLFPFVPRYEGDYRFKEEENIELVDHYVRALGMRMKAHELLAIFGGKMPHNVGTIAGGVTSKVTTDKIVNFLWRAKEIKEFVDNIYIPDVLKAAEVYSDYFTIGSGCGNLLAYGGFEQEGNEMLFKPGMVSTDLKKGNVDALKITEDVKSSWYADASTHKNPAEGETIPEPGKKGAYSFLKSPRYDGKVYELGPLARIAVNYVSGDEKVKTLVDSVLKKFKAGPDKLFSVLGRHAARAIDAKIVVDAMIEWVQQLKPGEPSYTQCDVPDEASGIGLTEAPRGALGHWITIKGGKIDRYQVITPTAWNASPKDDNDQPGPIEQALIGTKIKDEDNPFEIVRIVRSFDPCLACSVHLVDYKGNEIGVVDAGC